MKTILLGGLDPDLSGQVYKAFEPLQKEFTLQTVGSLGELLVLLETAQGDLLFLDLDSPGGVAMEWLAHLAEVKSSIPILGAGHAERPDITGYELRFPDHFFPFLTYLRKPLTAADVLRAVQTEIRHVARGVIEGLSLATLLQMFHMEGKTCTIRVSSGRRQGFFYMRAGQIINARYRRKEGMEAALLLLASASPKAEIDGQLHDSTVLIHARIEELMMEAMRVQDEHTRDHGEDQDDDSEDEEGDLPRSETGKWITQPTVKAAPAAPPPPPRKKRFLLIAAAVVLPFTAIPFFLPREAHVAIQSTPPGAMVTLDGRPKGSTPLELTLPKPLRGSLKVELTGYEPQTGSLRPGEDSVSFELKPVPPAPDPLPPVVSLPAPVEEPAPIPVARKAGKAPAPKKPRDVFDQIRQP
jgi:hypothetical protein